MAKSMGLPVTLVSQYKTPVIMLTKTGNPPVAFLTEHGSTTPQFIDETACEHVLSR
jgi:hypothetical protein